jgi:hypothetical protein
MVSQITNLGHSDLKDTSHNTVVGVIQSLNPGLVI